VARRIARTTLDTIIAIVAGLVAALLGHVPDFPTVNSLVGQSLGWAGLTASILHFNHAQKLDRHSYGWCFRNLLVALTAYCLVTLAR
jgi:hypothetical protein